MNKIYKVIWSKVKNCYIVASELAKNHTKSPKSDKVGFIFMDSLESQLNHQLSKGFVAGVFPMANRPVAKLSDFKITVAAIVKNEAENVPKWVNAARSCADEIVVVDTGSTDDTVEKFRDYGIECYHYDWNDDFASAKNYMISLCHGDWIVLLDGDEWFREGCDVRKAIAKHHNNPMEKAIIADWICLDSTRNNMIMFSGGAVRAFRNHPSIRYFRKVHENLTLGYENFVFEPEFKMYHTGYSGDVNRSKHERNLRIMRTMFDFDNGKVEYPTDWRYVQDTYAGLGDFEKSMEASDRMLEYGVQEYSAASWITRFNVLFAMKADLKRMDKEFEYCFKTVPSVSGFRFLAAIYYFKNGVINKGLDNYIEGLRMLMGPQDKVALEHTYWRMYLPEASMLASAVYLKNKQVEAALYACKVSEQYCGQTVWTDSTLANIRHIINNTEEVSVNISDRLLPVLQFSKKTVLASALVSSLAIGVLGMPNIVFAACCNLNGVATNQATGTDATVTGGACNIANTEGSSVSGGCCNVAGCWGYYYQGNPRYLLFIDPNNDGSNLSGNPTQTASGNYASVSGGLCNYALGNYSSILGGQRNATMGDFSTVIGGCCNYVTAEYGVVIAGCCNNVGGYYGYYDNNGDDHYVPLTCNKVYDGYYHVDSTHQYEVFECEGVRGVVIAGQCNTTAGGDGIVVGGYCNVSLGGTVVDGMKNVTRGTYSSILGGESNDAKGVAATIGGGRCNYSNGLYSSIVGGSCNTVDYTNYESTIVGGVCNHIIADDYGHWNESATIVGGGYNRVEPWGNYALVAGGSSNSAHCEYSSVFGGGGNSAEGEHGTVLGGDGNVVGDKDQLAEGFYSTIAGGCFNKAKGVGTAVFGGCSNTVSGCAGVVSGGMCNRAGTAYTYVDVNGKMGYVQGYCCNLYTDTEGEWGDPDYYSGYYVDVRKNNVWNTYRATAYEGDGSSAFGGNDNSSFGHFTTTLGGNCNFASACYATIMGGTCNKITSTGYYYYEDSDGVKRFVTGKTPGVLEYASTYTDADNVEYSLETMIGDSSVIIGGKCNTIASCYASINSGVCNRAFGNYSSITGGCNNQTEGEYATIIGAQCSVAKGTASMVVGGENTKAYANKSVSIGGGITGDELDTIVATNSVAIGSGATTTRDYEVSIGSTCAPVKLDGLMTVDGAKTVTDGTTTKTWTEILNAGGSTVGLPGCNNVASGCYSYVSGGMCNTSSACYSSVSGGERNVASGCASLIAGGMCNVALGVISSVVGGSCNYVDSDFGVATGGTCNISGSYASYRYYDSTVHDFVYGFIPVQDSRIHDDKITLNNTDYSVQYHLSGAYNSAFGGKDNIVNGNYSSVISGQSNITTGCFTTVVGGKENYAGNYYTYVDNLNELNYLYPYDFRIVDGKYKYLQEYDLTETNGEYATAIGGLHNRAISDYSTVSGGQCNLASGSFATVSGGYCNIASGRLSSISGGTMGIATSYGSAVSGGGSGRALNDYASISGGLRNIASGYASSVVAGYQNSATADYTSVTGGNCNIASGHYSSVSAGSCNVASCYYASVSGGSCNAAACDYASVSGGTSNAATSTYASVAGGFANLASNTASFVAGGCMNVAGCYYSTVLGGKNNHSLGTNSVVSGGSSNMASGCESYVAGGCSNQVTGLISTVFGGISNVSGAYGSYVDSSGNTQYVSLTDNRINDNKIAINDVNYDLVTYTGTASSVTGGNTNKAIGDYSSVSGGRMNISSNTFSHVSGGLCNTSNGVYSTIFGGTCNTASGVFSSISAGACNQALGAYSSVVGGTAGIAIADLSTVIGGGITGIENPDYDSSVTGSSRYLGTGSIAIGKQAQTTQDFEVAIGSQCAPVTIGGDLTVTSKIHGVTAGIADTDAVNVGQMNQALANLGVSELDALAIKYDSNTKERATFAGSQGTVLGNLKAGAISATSMEAINGSQLYAVKQDITGFATDIARNSENIRTMNASVTSALSSVAASGLLVDTMDVSKADASLNNLTESGKRILKQYAENAVQEYMAAQQETSAPMAPMAVSNTNSNTLTVTNAGNGSLHVGEGSYVNGTSSIAIGVGNQVNANNSGAFGDPSVINADESYVLGNDDTINTGATGSFIVGNDGVSDAKGGLLFGSNTKATQDAIDGVAIGNSTEVLAKNAIALGSGSIADTENTVSIGNSTLKRKIINVADGDISQNSNEAVTGAQLFVTNEKVQKNTEALEKKADVDASNINTSDWSQKLGIGQVKAGNKDLVTGGTVYDAIKDIGNNQLIQTDGDAITIGANSNASTINVAGSSGQGRVIAGVVTDANDMSSAANVGYVNQVGQDILQATNGALQRVDNKVNKVGANAAAMANLPTPTFDGEEKWAFAAGVGHYQGETAGAVGAFYKPNDNVIAKVSGSFGNGDEMVGAGVAVSLNKANTPVVSKAQLLRKINAMEQDRQADKAEIAQLKALVGALMERVEKLS